MKQVQINYNSYLYIGSNKIIYLQDNKYYELKLNKNILDKGAILNKDRFIFEYNKFLKQNGLSRVFWNKRLKVIYTDGISYNDLKIIKYTFEEIGYRRAAYISDKSLLKLNKKDVYLIGGKILRLYYIDKYNQKRNLFLDPDVYNEREMRYLIKSRALNKNLIIINDTPKIIDLINGCIRDFYYYVDKTNFFLKKFEKSL